MNKKVFEKVEMSTTAPKTTSVVWYNPKDKMLRIYNNGKWEHANPSTEEEGGLIEVNNDEVHIKDYNDELRIRVDAYGGVTIGDEESLHITVGGSGDIHIADGEGNSVIEVMGRNIYFKDADDHPHFQFDIDEGLVSIVGPSGTKMLDFTDAVITAINGLVS